MASSHLLAEGQDATTSPDCAVSGGGADDGAGLVPEATGVAGLAKLGDSDAATYQDHALDPDAAARRQARLRATVQGLIAQMDHLGRLLVHQEVRAHNVGLEKHIETSLRPLLYSNKYLGYKIAIVGDPSGVSKGSIGEESCFDAMKRLGLPAFPAPTNDIGPRLRAVESLLGQQVNGGPKLMISRAGCPHLSRAMSGGYRFTKHKTGALKVVPDKNDKEGFSHVSDDLQYLALVVHGGLVPEIQTRLRPRTKKRAAATAAGWT
jgi:hypothetical protein